ncbi:MAG: hypothetical protein ACI3ZO_02520 [Candidatus Cryptobacteroides sp.]
MTRKYLCYILSAMMPFVSSSCSEQEDSSREAVPVIQMQGRIVTVEPEGGVYDIGYTLSDYVSGETVEPDINLFSFSCDADWCGDFNVDDFSGRVEFSVKPNVAEKSRLASVTVKYADSEAVFSVSQAGIGENPDMVSKMKFDIEYDIDGPHVKMTVTPEYDDVRYYIAYSRKSEVDEYGDRIQSVIKANVEKFLSGEINVLVNYGGCTFEQALDQYVGKGVRTVSMSLNGESDFVGWCCAVNSQAKVISDVVLKEFRTGTIPPSDNKLAFELSEVNCDRVKYSVKTSNNDQWASLVVPADEVEGKDAEQIRQMFNSSEDVTAYLHFGDWSGSVGNLEEGKKYCILAFGYSWGAITTDIIKEYITTPLIESGTSEFTLTIDKVTHYRAVCGIKPTLKTKLYYADILYPGETLDSAVKDIESQIDWMSRNGYGDKVSILRRMGYRGDESIMKTGLEDGTTYRFFVLPVDETTGDFQITKDQDGNVVASSIFSSAEFTTSYARQSSAYINVEHSKWFSGNDYAVAFPEEGAGAEGYAMMPVTVQKHGNVADYWYCVYGADLTDAGKYTDNDLIRYLTGFTYTDENGNEQEYEADGIKNEPYKVLACDYGKTLTLVSVAYDDEDNWGPVIREKLYFTHEGDSPISEFKSQSAAIFQIVPEAKWK